MENYYPHDFTYTDDKMKDFYHCSCYCLAANLEPTPVPPIIRPPVVPMPPIGVVPPVEPPVIPMPPIGVVPPVEPPVIPMPPIGVVPPVEPPVVERPTLRLGSTGYHVVALQQLLNDHGYLKDGIDGIFGVKTEAAVKKFQSAQGLKVDGIVGPKTWAALMEAKLYGKE